MNAMQFMMPEPTNEEPPETIDEEPETINDEPRKEPEARIKVEAEASSESDIEVQVIPTTTRVKNMLDMQTTTKTLEQVQCKARFRMMSTKTYKKQTCKILSRTGIGKAPCGYSSSPTSTRK